MHSIRNSLYHRPFYYYAITMQHGVMVLNINVLPKVSVINWFLISGFYKVISRAADIKFISNRMAKNSFFGAKTR